MTLSAKAKAAILLLAIAWPLASAQSNDDLNPAAKFVARAAKLPAYDVISIHQNKNGTEDSSVGTTKDGIVIVNASFPEIIEFAYNIASFDLISDVPGPLASARFDIRAKIASLEGDRPAKLTDDDFQAMTISLLADRFHLRTRVLPKKMTVYEIVVASGGPKITLDEPLAPTLKAHWGRENTLTFNHSDMSMLAGVLSDSGMHRLVVDRTGLKGAGTFTLKWSSDEAQQQGGSNLVSIYTAIQDQLGLKLQPAKLPIDTLVIDHAEMPTEN
jgi:bla regulator protein blaR1